VAIRRFTRLLALALTIGITTSALAQPTPQPAIDNRVSGIARALAFTVVIEGSGIYGAGALVAPARGLVLTNYHVVQNMTAPRVTFSDGAQAAGQVIDFDPKLDLALVKIPPQRRPGPVFAEAGGIQPGEELYAIGNPRHLGFSVARGIVSFVDRQVEGVKYLQTDLPINEGNSGGPLVNARGELVGVMTFVLKRAQGLSFALPASYAPSRFTMLGDSLEGERRKAGVRGSQATSSAAALPDGPRQVQDRP
jgi:S1-C subfamily serine protease